MGKGRPLFEILQQQKEAGGAKPFGSTARTSRQPETPAAANAAPPPVGRTAQTAARDPQPAAEKPIRDTEEGFNPAIVLQWLGEPVNWHLSRVASVGVVAALVALVGVSFVAGQRVGEQSAVAEHQEYHAAAGSLADFQRQPVQGLLPSSSAPSQVEPTPGHTARAAMGDGEGDGDPRIDGLNYFRLIVVPSSAGEEIYRIVDFLRDHEVDAAVVPINNGRSLKVVALPGFDRPRSDPRALALQERLKVLGRKWRTEHRGSTDWRDLMAEKYRPGVN